MGVWSNFLWIIELSNYELYKCIRLQLPIVSVYHSQNSMQYFLLITWTLYSEYAKQPSFLLFYSSLWTTSVTPMRCEEQPETSYREQSATRRAAHLTEFLAQMPAHALILRQKKPLKNFKNLVSWRSKISECLMCSKDLDLGPCRPKK